MKLRGEELLALADTIKILNDDDALELFKKTLPGASASFMQVTVTAKDQLQKALSIVRDAQKSHGKRPELNFLALALQGKAVDFTKVIKMIDEMVKVLTAEQQDDNDKKEYCETQFDLADDKKKGLERSVSNLEKAIAKEKEGVAALAEEIAALEASIAELDKSVAEATEQRKEENAEYSELMASDSAAKELLGFAKNRLNKFYNPKLYKAPPKRVLSEEEQLTVSMGGTLAPTAAPGGIAGTGVTVMSQIKVHTGVAPPPPPDAPGAYQKKSEESGGVIAMIDLIVKDLDKEMTVAKAEEKDAHGDYEQMMKDSAEKRADDSKSLANKEKTLADLEANLQTATDDKASAGKELLATTMYIQQLHNECDWLLQYS